MTREEAIESVKSAFDAWEYNYDTGDDWSREHEARDMAIKALEQEPCDDAISRHVIKEQMIKYGFHAPDMTVTEFVENLPPVIPQTRWIPVSERLPDKNGRYLVTVKQGYITFGAWVDDAENWAEVTAWMPLPKPYKESEV